MKRFSINKYIGAEYKDLGRVLEDGVDCWGLVREFYQRELGIHLPTLLGEYSSAVNRDEVAFLIDEERQSWVAINSGEERPGDVILLKVAGVPWHVGIVLEYKQMLHVHKGCNAVVEKYTSNLWKRRIYGFVRHQQATY